MNVIVTAGPTYEALDGVRRLTNFSTGRLGSELAGFLTVHSHRVTLLIGEQATFRGERHAEKVETFTTRKDLSDRLQALGTPEMGAVFHAAAVSDFAFGKVWRRSASGQLSEIKSGKISTREGTLLAELVPTPKIIALLRDWFSRAKIVGWKYEVEGDRAGVIRLAEGQIKECRTDACVANGSAYGPGFGLVTAAGKAAHLVDTRSLFEALGRFIGGNP